jgi:hypothetical protein
MHKNSEHFGNVMADGAWSRWAILHPPIRSLLDLYERLRGNPDTKRFAHRKR